MECNQCWKETDKTDGSSRGKPIYICECGNRFTTTKRPDIDRYLAHQLNGYNVRYVAELLGCSVGFAHKWSTKKPPTIPDQNDINQYVKRNPKREILANIFGVILSD